MAVAEPREQSTRRQKQQRCIPTTKAQVIITNVITEGGRIRYGQRQERGPED